jgi:pimeloyl-ACP methyl ester carboxylesterase
VHQSFWDYSFEEMAKFDLPAVFEFVIGKTGVETVTYIGHSQGTTQMFCALIENSSFFAPKVNIAIMLAPVARVDRMSSSTIQRLKESHTLHNLVAKEGQELFSSP